MKRHQGPKARQTRIVATIGVCHDADWPTYLRKMCEAGVDVMRLNLSHADPEYGKEKAILAWANTPPENMAAPLVAVMADLQGPKCRIGKFPVDGIGVIPGQHVALVPASTQWNELAALAVHPDPLPRIPVPEPLGQTLLRGLTNYVAEHPGAMPTVLFGDGDITAEVVAVRDGWVQAVISAGGVLGSRKGLTVRDLDLDLDPFPEKDQRDLKFCLEQGIDAVALSFVRTPDDVERVRAFIAEHAPGEVERVRLIAKIETLSAIRHIDAILDACDGIMIARGDLGLQLGVEEVPMTQKQLIVAARRHGKPCIVATQMLESMINSPVPTRAEATDVFNAILDGGDAVMLSGETSVGSRPYLVVATMDRIARKAEAYRLADRARRPPIQLGSVGEPNHIERTNEQFAQTAVQFAENIPARLADEIFAQQPNMLASILVLPRMGVGMEQLEVALHILLVTFQAMKLSGHAWPVVTEDVQDGCMQRLTARARFNEGLPPELAHQVVQQFCDEHPERNLLAFVYGYLGDHDLLAVRTEAEKFLMLGALNLVECLACAGSATAA